MPALRSAVWLHRKMRSAVAHPSTNGTAEAEREALLAEISSDVVMLSQVHAIDEGQLTLVGRNGFGGAGRTITALLRLGQLEFLQGKTTHLHIPHDLQATLSDPDRRFLKDDPQREKQPIQETLLLAVAISRVSSEGGGLARTQILRDLLERFRNHGIQPGRFFERRDNLAWDSHSLVRTT
jgi:hypothetical protein